jgi:hypothetical protein
MEFMPILGGGYLYTSKKNIRYLIYIISSK